MTSLPFRVMKYRSCYPHQRCRPNLWRGKRYRSCQGNHERNRFKLERFCLTRLRLYAVLFLGNFNIGNTVYFAGLASGSAGVTTGTINFWSFANGTVSTSSETQLQATTAGWSVSISSEPSKTLDCLLRIRHEHLFAIQCKLWDHVVFSQTIVRPKHP